MSSASPASPAASSASGAPPRDALRPQAPYRRALVLANPTAGRHRGASVAEEVAEGLRVRGVAVEVHLTRSPGDAAERVRRRHDETDLLVSVGGDGTLSEVLTGLGPDDVPVGVLPLGTGNVLSHDLGLPREVERALETFVAGRTVEVDVARANDRLCFLVASVGPDAMVVEEVARRRRGPITQWAYLPAAVRVWLRYRPVPISVELDGEPLDGTFHQVIVSNMIHYGGLVRLCPERVLADGRYEVLLFRHGGKLRLLGYVLRGLLGRLPGGSCEMRRARRVRITAACELPLQIDGDPSGTTPVEVEVTDRRYRLLVP